MLQIFLFSLSSFVNPYSLPIALEADREESFNYSGSDNEEEETTQAGEPSSIVQAPAGDTLRRNFQQIQVKMFFVNVLYIYFIYICILFFLSFSSLFPFSA